MTFPVEPANSIDAREGQAPGGLPPEVEAELRRRLPGAAGEIGPPLLRIQYARLPGSRTIPRPQRRILAAKYFMCRVITETRLMSPRAGFGGRA